MDNIINSSHKYCCSKVGFFYWRLTYLKDLKAGDVQDSYEVLAGQWGVEGPVDATHQPLEHSVVCGFGQRTDCVVYLQRWRSRIGWGLQCVGGYLGQPKEQDKLYCVNF